MKQLVIQDGHVLATHEVGQDLRGLYPGTEIVQFSRPFKMPLGGWAPDPRTDEEKKLAYQDRRRAEYPSIADQLDMIYWDQVNGTTVWRDAIAAVKAKYPKSSQLGA